MRVRLRIYPHIGALPLPLQGLKSGTGLRYRGHVGLALLGAPSAPPRSSYNVAIGWHALPAGVLPCMEGAPHVPRPRRPLKSSRARNRIKGARFRAQVLLPSSSLLVLCGIPLAALSPCPPLLPQQSPFMQTHSPFSPARRFMVGTNLSSFSGRAPSGSCTRRLTTAQTVESSP